MLHDDKYIDQLKEVSSLAAKCYLQSQNVLVDAVLAEEVQAMLDHHWFCYEVFADGAGKLSCDRLYLQRGERVQGKLPEQSWSHCTRVGFQGPANCFLDLVVHEIVVVDVLVLMGTQVRELILA